VFGLGLPEIIVIFVILFLLFGAKRLPEIGEGIGKTIKELRKIRDERREWKERKREDQKKNLGLSLKDEIEDISGIKEIKENAEKLKGIKKFLK